jgi:hypothetical protein
MRRIHICNAQIVENTHSQGGNKMGEISKCCLIALILVVASFPKVILAGDDAKKDKILYFDEVPTGMNNLHFDDDKDIVPLKNDFELISFAPMSNDAGDRWALITVRNSASGSRKLIKKYMVATFANGKRTYAKALDIMIDGGELYSEAIEFGKSKFPIIKVEMR